MAVFVRSFLLSLVLVVSAGAQESRWLPYPIFRSKAFRRAMDNGTRTSWGSPGDEYWVNRAHYAIDAELDPATARLSGHVRIRYENRSPRRIRRLRIHLRQNLHKEGVIRNVPVEITGGMEVGEVSVNGVTVGEGSPAGGLVATGGTLMRIRLPEALRPGGEVTIEMDFAFTVPAAGNAPRMGHEDHHVFYLGYWYPQVAVFEDVRGWVADPYMGIGEFYMDWADYDVSITAPVGFIVRATGELLNPEEVLSEQVRQRLQEARETREVVRIVGEKERRPGLSTAESESGKLTWRFRARNVRDVAVCLSDTYVWDATHAVVEEGGEGRPPRIAMIHAVYEPDGSTGKVWRRAAEWERATIEFMSRELMPYPWPHMTACEGIVGGGMEYPMMTCVGGGGLVPMVREVLIHELIHMWFPMIVGSDEKHWAWMDEGLTSFYTVRCSAHIRDKEPNYRQDQAMYRSLARAGSEVPIMRPADSFHESNSMPFFMATYQKTSAVLHQLEAVVGRETFDKAMRRYVKEWAFKHPHPVDLFATFEDVVKKDLDWYFRIWFYETWTLDTAIEDVIVSEKESRVLLKDQGKAFGPTVVEVEYEDGSKERQVMPVSYWQAGRRISGSLVFKPGVRRAVIDPDGATLDVNRKNNRWRAEEGG